jgi:hypothetical protein
MPAAWPAPLRPLLDGYLAQFDARLPGVLAGWYVLGSVALGEFHPTFSDVDFVALLARPLAPAEVAELSRLHQQLARAHPRWPLSGGYLPLAALTPAADVLTTAPHYHDGRLRAAGQFELHSADGWTWQRHGLALRGPEPAALPLRVDWPTLLARMHANTRTYWGRWATSPRQWLLLLSGWGVQWAVLGVLRQWYTYREGAITTKRRAGEYALVHLPAKWHTIVAEAVRLRDRQSSTYRSRLARANDARRFLQYIIADCNDLEHSVHTI